MSGRNCTLGRRPSKAERLLRFQPLYLALAALVALGVGAGPVEAHFIRGESVDERTRAIRYTETSDYNDAIGHAEGAWNQLGRISIL